MENNIKNTTTAVIAAGVVLAAVIVTRTPAQRATGGDPCPADIDGDANAGILDYLQLLGAWGPCPGAAVVAFGPLLVSDEEALLLRLWSDNN